MVRILQISNHKDLREIMQGIKVDTYGIKIMLPKVISHLVKVNSLSNIAANILKQEMLSQGGDVAIAREALTGRAKRTDCLLIGSLAHFDRLRRKLKMQPFGLHKLAQDLSYVLANYQKENFTPDLGRYRLNLKAGHSYIMGIVNLTPDSFSGDGLYRQGCTLKNRLVSEEVVDYVEKMVEDGADIVDIGGESTRPGAKPVSEKEELRRTIPAIKKIVRRIRVPISIDTYKPEVARQALDNGAVIVNDITGLRNPKMVKIVSLYKSGVVIMHMKANPATMQHNPRYVSLLDEIISYLERGINRAVSAGIDREKIIIDPGIGFGKTSGDNLKILKNLKEFKILGRPLLVGPSRKSFIGKILNAPEQERIFGTVSSCVLAAENGANILRVHDVKEIRQALKVSCAISQC